MKIPIREPLRFDVAGPDVTKRDIPYIDVDAEMAKQRAEMRTRKDLSLERQKYERARARGQHAWVSFVESESYFVDGRVLDVRDRTTQDEARAWAERRPGGGWGRIGQDGMISKSLI